MIDISSISAPYIRKIHVVWFTYQLTAMMRMRGTDILLFWYQLHYLLPEHDIYVIMILFIKIISKPIAYVRELGVPGSKSIYVIEYEIAIGM
jgi:hypothetical protein